MASGQPHKSLANLSKSQAVFFQIKEVMMSRISPVRDSVAVDLSSNDFAFPTGFNNVYVGTSGTLTVLKPNGGSQTYVGLAAGIYHPIQGIGIVRSTTTASNLVVGLS